MKKYFSANTMLYSITFTWGEREQLAKKYMRTHKSCLTAWCVYVRESQSREKDLNTGRHQLSMVNPNLAEFLLSRLCFPSELEATKDRPTTVLSN